VGVKCWMWAVQRSSSFRGIGFILENGINEECVEDESISTSDALLVL
jgi:hypothetical protein